MTTYTVTTAVNADTLASKTGSDVYNINGGYLTVDQHSRYGVNQNTSAAMGNITLSATLGGTIEFNSTLVRLIPFNTGTGTVPALNTVISQGGASGKLLGVYAAINAAPTAAAAAMPASGFILVRQWNGVAYAAGALTGISASATAADRAGWLEIVGVDALTVTVNRLNLFKVRGDYYDFLGATTDGVRATTYQLPTNGDTACYFPGVEVETGTGTGVYEFYPCAGSMAALAANIATDAVRGRWCWVSTAGLVRFGSDGTNATGGFVPPAGRRVRAYNLFFMTCTAVAPTVNVLPNATLTTRYEFFVTGGGVLDIDKASFNWFLNLNQPYSVALSNVSTLTALQLTECASPIAWTAVSVGQEAANPQTAFTASFNFAGGTMARCTWTRASLPNLMYVASWADCANFTVTDERTHSLTKAVGTTTGSVSASRVTGSLWVNPVLGGGKFFAVNSSGIRVNNPTYYDHPATTTQSTIPMSVFDASTSCTDCTLDGLNFGGLSLVQPYAAILTISQPGCRNVKMRNIGTPAAPLDLGGAQVDATWTQATTTATALTPTAHGLKTGDIVYVLISSNTGIIVVGSKTLLSVPTATTFTFACLTGALTGTLTYYPTVTGLLLSVSGGSANIKAQRVYTDRTRIGLISADNATKNVLLESVWGDPMNAVGGASLGTIMRGVRALPSLLVQTSVYGTHYLEAFTTGTPAATAGVAWTRATTTATATSAAHGLRTGDLVNVTVTSDAAAIVLGQKTLTVLSSGAVTFPCLNAGAVSGTLTFVPLNGRVAIQMNEPTAETASQVTLTNGAVFTSAGGLYMPTIGQQADFTFSGNVIGHSAFPISEAVMTVTNGAMGNYDLSYSLDGGATYRNLAYNRAGGGGAGASTNVTVTDTTGVSAGDYVFGTGVAPNAKVNSVTNGTTVAVDTANTSAVSGVLRFNRLPGETVADASVGFPLRVRIKTTTVNAGAINSLYFFTLSTAASRAFQYPLDVNTVTFTGLPTGTDVVVLTSGTTTILAQQDAGAGTTFAYTYSGAQTVDVGFIKQGYVPQYLRALSLTAVDSSIPVALTLDRNYT